MPRIIVCGKTRTVTRMWKLATENRALFEERPVVGPFFFATAISRNCRTLRCHFRATWNRLSVYQQDGAARTANATMTLFREFFGERVIFIREFLFIRRRQSHRGTLKSYCGTKGTDHRNNKRNHAGGTDEESVPRRAKEVRGPKTVVTSSTRFPRCLTFKYFTLAIIVYNLLEYLVFVFRIRKRSVRELNVQRERSFIW